MFVNMSLAWSMETHAFGDIVQWLNGTGFFSQSLSEQILKFQASGLQQSGLG